MIVTMNEYERIREDLRLSLRLFFIHSLLSQLPRLG